MDSNHVDKMISMSVHLESGELITNNLLDLILRCELVILSSNSNHVESDLKEACKLRKTLNRENVVFACLAGSFCYDEIKDISYVLCEKYTNLAFFSGFHRHGSLMNPSDTFTKASPEATFESGPQSAQQQSNQQF